MCFTLYLHFICLSCVLYKELLVQCTMKKKGDKIIDGPPIPHYDPAILSWLVSRSWHNDNVTSSTTVNDYKIIIFIIAWVLYIILFQLIHIDFHKYRSYLLSEIDENDVISHTMTYDQQCIGIMNENNGSNDDSIKV